MILVLSVVTTALLSLLCLNVRYYWIHYIAMTVCSLGVFVTIFTDLRDDQGNFSFGNLEGDIFAVISAICYGITSIINDYLLRTGSNNYAINAHLGLFGVIFSSILQVIFN